TGGGLPIATVTQLSAAFCSSINRFHPLDDLASDRRVGSTLVSCVRASKTQQVTDLGKHLPADRDGRNADRTVGIRIGVLVAVVESEIHGRSRMHKIG